MPDDTMRRSDAVRYLRELGAPISETTLATRGRADKGGGPRYTIINNKAVYRREDLETWLKSEMEKGKR
jgi:hypothetical protein